MLQKITFLGFLATATCLVIHHAPLPTYILMQPTSTPNYNFAYEVNDQRTGDIKSQMENRRGGNVRGQYTVVQPDGIRRIVEYNADDVNGFRATVNNEAVPIEVKTDDKKEEEQTMQESEKDVKNERERVPFLTPTFTVPGNFILQPVQNIQNPWFTTVLRR